MQDQLYDKISEEYDRLITNMKRRPPGEIVDNAYEITFKREILDYFADEGFIDNDGAEKLLSMREPLEELYKGWQDTDPEYLDHIRESIKDTIRELPEPSERASSATRPTVQTAISANGAIRPGDWVIAAPYDEYGYLLGTVKEIVKLGTPEHADESDNDTDNVHVDFYAFDYPPERIAEIEEYFSNLYGEPKTFGELPLDDVIMAPDTLIRITELGHDEIARMGDLLANCKAFCNCYASPESQSERHAELLERLEKNLTDYQDSLMNFGNRELIEMADKIAAVSNVYSYLCYRGFERDELDFLLQFQNPLEVATEGWLDYNIENDDEMGFAFDNIVRHKQDWLDSYPLMSNAVNHAKTESLSGEPVEPSADKPKQTLANKLHDAGEKAVAHDAHNSNTTNRNRNDSGQSTMPVIETEMWKKNPDKPGTLIFDSQRAAQDIFDELTAHLKADNRMPDEYFLLGMDWQDGALFPNDAEILCNVNYGGSEGIYLDIDVNYKKDVYEYSRENGVSGWHNRTVTERFATGKTLGESVEDLDRMYLAASSVTAAFYGYQEQIHTRYAVVKHDEEKPKTLADRLQAAGEKAKEQNAHNKNTTSRTREERE